MMFVIVDVTVSSQRCVFRLLKYSSHIPIFVLYKSSPIVLCFSTSKLNFLLWLFVFCPPNTNYCELTHPIWSFLSQFSPSKFSFHLNDFTSLFQTSYILSSFPSHPSHSDVLLVSLFSSSSFPRHTSCFIFLTRSPLSSLFLTSFLLPFIHPSVISIPSLPPSLLSLCTIFHPSLCPSSIPHSRGILWLISLFSFFFSLSLFFLSLSLICPCVFCSIYHLDTTLLLFINTLYRLLHTCTYVCLQRFLLTCTQ